MLAFIVLAAAPKWIDNSLAGYALAYDETHKPIGIRDPRSGYMLVRGVECDGAFLTLLLTRDRKAVASEGFRLPKKGSKNDGVLVIVDRRLTSLRTGKGIEIGTSPHKVQASLGSPKRIELKGRFVNYVYEWKAQNEPVQTQRYTFKAEKLIEVCFVRDEREE